MNDKLLLHHWKDSVCLNCGEAGSFQGPCLRIPSPSPDARLEAERAVIEAASVYRRGESTAVDLFDAVDALDKLEAGK